jgi:hypothetical protein
MRSLKTAGLASALAIGLGLVVVPTATRADTFNLTSCDISGGCGTATQFGTVKLTQSGTSVLVDVVLNSGNIFATTGAGNKEYFLFNDSLSGSTITGITATFNGTTVNPGPLAGFTNISTSTGSTTFTASVECTTCTGTSGVNVNDLHFTVTNETIAGLETTTGIFSSVADILCGQTGCPAGGPTGLVDVSTGPIPPVPIPPAAMLFGSALVGLGLLGRRRRKGGLAQA